MTSARFSIPSIFSRAAHHAPPAPRPDAPKVVSVVSFSRGGVANEATLPLCALSGIDREANGAIQILVEGRYF